MYTVESVPTIGEARSMRPPVVAVQSRAPDGSTAYRLKSSLPAYRSSFKPSAGDERTLFSVENAHTSAPAELNRYSLLSPQPTTMSPLGRIRGEERNVLPRRAFQRSVPFARTA